MCVFRQMGALTLTHKSIFKRHESGFYRLYLNKCLKAIAVSSIFSSIFSFDSILFQFVLFWECCDIRIKCERIRTNREIRQTKLNKTKIKWILQYECVYTFWILIRFLSIIQLDFTLFFFASLLKSRW